MESGKTLPLPEHISQYKNNTALSEIKNEDALINFFLRGILTSIMRRIFSMDTVPDTVEKWYTQALHFKLVWEWADNIAKEQGNKNHTYQRPVQKPKDLNAMDVDAICLEQLTPKERQRCIENNLCFKCRKPGHSAAKCRNPFMNKPTTIAKIKEVPNNDSATIRRITTLDF